MVGRESSEGSVWSLREGEKKVLSKTSCLLVTQLGLKACIGGDAELQDIFPETLSFLRLGEMVLCYIDPSFQVLPGG